MKQAVSLLLAYVQDNEEKDVMVCTENNEFGVTENVAGEGLLWIGDIL